MAHLGNFEPILPDPQPHIGQALALYDRVSRERRGRVVFITAELGGGKTEQLDALSRALSQAEPAPAFVAGYFRGGEYHPYSLEWQRPVSLQKTVMAAGGISSLMGLFPAPFAFAATFVGQLIETCVGAREFADELRDNPPLTRESADWLRKILRSATGERPLVCLIDDWDEAPRFYWDSMLLSFSREIARNVPLLIFITFKRPIRGASSGDNESTLTEVVKRLTEKGLAELWTLRKLSRDEVAAAIGRAAPSVADKLHGVTGGNARWVKELWREWRQKEVVVTDQADQWVWGADHKATLNMYDTIVGDRLTRLLGAATAAEVEDTRDILACAALEGERFTADAVARAMGFDRDELIDFFDDVLVRTEANPDGLLSEEGGVNIATPDGATRTLWRYSFVSDLHWMALERYGFADEPRPGQEDSEKQEKIAALVDALREVYTPEERLVAAPVARLLRAIGREEDASHYERVGEYSAHQTLMRDHATYLLALNKDEWEQWECRRAAEFLVQAGTAMFHSCPFPETQAVFEESHELAVRAEDDTIAAHALYLSGNILFEQGEYRVARERAVASLSIFRRIGKKSGEAVSLYLLAKIDNEEGRNAEAYDAANQALEVHLEVSNRQGVCASLTLLAKINYDEDRYEEAYECATQAMEVSQEIGDRHGEAVSLHQLAKIDFDRGRYAEAREQLTISLEIEREIGNRHGEAISLILLAEIDCADARHADARERATQSLTINEEIGDRAGAAYALRLLAKVEEEEGQHAEARERITQSPEIEQATGDRHREAALINQMGESDYAAGLYIEAGERAMQALKISQEAGDRYQEAISLNLLGAVATNLGRPGEALELTTLSAFILTEIGHADVQVVSNDLGVLFAEQQYAEEQIHSLFQRVSEAYQKDSGRELIRCTLAYLRMDNG